MLSFKEVRNNLQVEEFIKQGSIALKALEYSEHGFRHARLIAVRAKKLAEDVSLSRRSQELAAIAGYCHDMGNFLGREQHHYWGALLFHQIFSKQMKAAELGWTMQAIANHDKYTMKLTNHISAIVVLADKSDVHRSRVLVKSLKRIRVDIHDRVNYAATSSKLAVDKQGKKIILVLRIDTNFCPVIEFFEIFTERMSYCRQAAEYLGYQFGLTINNFKLL